MPAFNQVILMGNLTRDPELKYTPKGKAVVNVTLAINKRVPDGQGGRIERVTYVEITFWEKAAEIIAQYVEKGHLFYCTGELDQSLRTVNAGLPNERQERKTKVTGVSFQLMPNNKRTDERGGKHSPAPPPGAPSSTTPRPAPVDREDVSPLDESDEIPF